MERLDLQMQDLEQLITAQSAQMEETAGFFAQECSELQARMDKETGAREVTLFSHNRVNKCRVRMSR